MSIKSKKYFFIFMILLLFSVIYAKNNTKWYGTDWIQENHTIDPEKLKANFDYLYNNLNIDSNLSNLNNNNNNIQLYNNGTVTFDANGKDLFLGYKKTRNLLFFTGNGDNKGIVKMRLTEKGNLGIGTTIPESRLDVNGEISFKKLRTKKGVKFECENGKVLIGFDDNGLICKKIKDLMNEVKEVSRSIKNITKKWINLGVKWSGEILYKYNRPLEMYRNGMSTYFLQTPYFCGNFDEIKIDSEIKFNTNVSSNVSFKRFFTLNDLFGEFKGDNNVFDKANYKNEKFNRIVKTFKIKKKYSWNCYQFIAFPFSEKNRKATIVNYHINSISYKKSNEAKEEVKIKKIGDCYKTFFEKYYYGEARLNPIMGCIKMVPVWNTYKESKIDFIVSPAENTDYCRLRSGYVSDGILMYWLDNYPGDFDWLKTTKISRSEERKMSQEYWKNKKIFQCSISKQDLKKMPLLKIYEPELLKLIK